MKRTIPLSAAVSAVLLTVACSQDPESAAPTPEISTDRIAAHVEFLADDLLQGRDNGTAEYEIAARYVAAQFRQLGLEPAGDDDSYLQEVPYLERQLNEDSAWVVITGPDGDWTLEYKVDFLMGGDTTRASTSVSAGLVFVGHGIVAPELGVDDYAGVDAEGKIAVVLSGAPASFPSEQRAYYSSGRTKSEIAVEHGVVGSISFNSLVDIQRRPWERSVQHAGRPGQSWIAEDGSASGHFPQLEGDAYISPDAARHLFAMAGIDYDALLQAADAGDYTPQALDLSATLSRRTSHRELSSSNVIATLPGSDPELADEYVVFTAHLDHVGHGPADDSGDTLHNGYYDNAMGVAMMIETARYLSELPTAPRRSVLFAAVGGEEKGLLGAEYFVGYSDVPASAMVANVNLDMPVLMEPTTEIIAFGAEHTTLGAAIDEAAAAVGWTQVPDPMPEEVVFVRSDHYMLVREGIPAVFLVPNLTPASMEFMGQHYHKPSDEPGLAVHWPSVAEFTELNAQAAIIVADADEPPRWHEDNFFGDLFAGDR